MKEKTCFRPYAEWCVIAHAHLGTPWPKSVVYHTP